MSSASYRRNGHSKSYYKISPYAYARRDSSYRGSANRSLDCGRSTYGRNVQSERRCSGERSPEQGVLIASGVAENKSYRNSQLLVCKNFTVDLGVNNTTVIFSLDTGADVTVLAKDTLDSLQLLLMILLRGLIGAGHVPLQVVEEANVCLESRRKSTSAFYQ